MKKSISRVLLENVTKYDQFSQWKIRVGFNTFTTLSTHGLASRALKVGSKQMQKTLGANLDLNLLSPYNFAF